MLVRRIVVAFLQLSFMIRGVVMSSQQPSFRGGRGRGKIDRRFDGGDNPKKQFFNKVVVKKTATIDSEEDAIRFFKEAMTFRDPMEFISLVTDESSSRGGPTALKRAFSLGCSSLSSMESLVSFIDYLGADIINRGSVKICTAKVFDIAYSTPGLLSSLHDSLVKGTIKDETAVAWFVLGMTRTNTEARNNPIVGDIAKYLEQDGKSFFGSQLATLLAPGRILQSCGPMSIDANQIESLDSLRALQPKHDNDHPFDYRSISIVPTANELTCKDTKSAVQTMGMFLSGDLSRNYSGENIVVSTVLDRQFRLLREDMIAPTKAELQEELGKNAHDCRRLFRNPQVVGIRFQPKLSLLIRVEVTSALKRTVIDL